MPYIVITKRPDPLADEAHAPLSGPRDPAMTPVLSIASRLAVATLEGVTFPCPRCNGSGSVEVSAHGSWEEHGTVYAECGRCNGSGECSPPESGGTVGPLPDGTVIEVEQVEWMALGSPTVQPSWPNSGQGILDAFNAREATRA